MKWVNLLIGITLGIELIGFGLVSAMICHSAAWICKTRKKGSELNKSIFICAIMCMSVVAIYLINSIYLTLCQFTTQTCIYVWINNAVYRIAKCFLYLFFTSRYDHTIFSVFAFVFVLLISCLFFQ